MQSHPGAPRTGAAVPSQALGTACSVPLAPYQPLFSSHPSLVPPCLKSPGPCDSCARALLVPFRMGFPCLDLTISYLDLSLEVFSNLNYPIIPPQCFSAPFPAAASCSIGFSSFSVTPRAVFPQRSLAVPEPGQTQLHPSSHRNVQQLFLRHNLLPFFSLAAC